METAIHLSPIVPHLIREFNAATRCIHLVIPDTGHWKYPPAGAATSPDDLYALLCKKARQGLQIELVTRKESTPDKTLKRYEPLVSAGIRVYPIGPANGITGVGGNFIIVDESTIIMGGGEIIMGADERDSRAYFTVIRENASLAGRFLVEFRRLQQYYHDELQWQIACLETDIPALENEKSGMEKTMSDFNYAYTKAFGGIILKILGLKKERLKQEGHTTRSEKYGQAEARYNNFHREVSRIIAQDIPDLGADQKNELKIKYRKAVLLCHPDRFQDEESKNKAHAIFLELQDAYTKNQFDKVTAILERLEQGILGAQTALARLRTEELEERLQYLIQVREGLLREITRLRNDPSYQHITSIPDMDLFFKEEEQRLLQELQQLHHESN